MRILLANLPWHKLPEGEQPGWRGIRAGSRWPHTFPYYGGDLIGGYMPFPFYLATASSLLKAAGFEVAFRDSIALGESYDDFYAFARSFRPDLVVVETSTPSVNHDLAEAGKLKEMLPGLRAVFCGIHAELEEERYFAGRREIDFVLYGEYERPLLSLAQALREGADLSLVGNLLYRQAGEVCKTACGPLPDLKEFPWPERDDRLAGRYVDVGIGLEQPQLQMHASRGCPFGCIFCVWPQVVYRSRRYRKRDPEDVVAEIEANLKRYPYRSIYFDDDTFNVDLAHILAIARLMKARGLHHIPWGAMGRADLMTREALIELKEAGLHSIKYGVESGDPKVLDEIGKRMQLKKVIEMVAFTREIGIKAHLTFTIGLPSDTAESIEGTIDLACRLDAESLQFSIATPFPGTKMYEIYERKGWLITKNWADYDGAAKAVSRTERFSGEELENYVKLAYSRWAEAKIRRALGAPAFQTALAAQLAERLAPGDRLVVLQSANINLTLALVAALKKSPFEIHVLTHERFAPAFVPLLDESRLHLFRNTGDFRIAALKDWALALRTAHDFKGAVVPYTNPDGANYEEVEQVALTVAPIIAAGVNMEGRLIR
ncbi:radical SAM protein [Heliobacterium undosum]|uniref:Radical SAM protein n=1 Tax=Heliomicrobium undosum TaxID=121734 RepID=A0A845L2W1_9FIRM|nr:radical SAM protein [Heliomicrobium undosum]MZP29449.1 radical SAM protein [Heliomicrobium undosum]